MNKRTNLPAFSKLSTKSQTVIPRSVREALKLGPGDTLRYRQTDSGVVIERAATEGDDPFATFTEWASEADDKAYADL